MSSASNSRCGTPRRHSRSSSLSSSQGSIKRETRVHVFVRARPNDDQISYDSCELPTSLEFPSDKEIKLSDTKQETTYRFDHVFPPETTNKKVCDVICTPLINTVLNGYNGSFMVYGQTGTGKTFTVQAEDGLIPTTISQLFKTINEDKESEYSVFLSYLQIYHERIYDLLDSSKETDLHLREHPDEGVIVEGLSEFEITSTNVANSLLEYGRKQLVVAETKLVRVSSRSHSMCILRVQKRKRRSEMTVNQDCIRTEESFLKGRLYLCDLAGSERLKKSGVTGERQREAKYINSSLLELGNVIHALSVAKSHHIPFRNSTLTRILKESLGGNSKASLMICVSSSLRHTSETKCSLNFGQRALRVTKSSSPNVEIDYKALSEYLTKKLKELENAYQFEKQTYKRMQEELKNARKGQSKIPVLTRRSKKPTFRDEEARVLKETCMAEEVNSNEMSMKGIEKTKEDIQQQPKNFEEREMDFSKDRLDNTALKVDYFDETDSGTPRTDTRDFKNQGSSQSNRLGRKGVTSISCQTDENANYLITKSDFYTDLEGLESKKKEVDILPVSEKIAKMTQNSFCQTDASYERPCKDEEGKDQESCKDEERKDQESCKDEERKDQESCKDEERKDQESCKDEERKDQESCKDEERKDQEICKDEERKNQESCKDEERNDQESCKDEERKDQESCKDEERKDQEICKDEERKDQESCKDEERKDQESCKDEERKDQEICKDEERKNQESCKDEERNDQESCKDEERKDQESCKDEERKDQEICKDEERNDQESCKDEERNDQESCKDEERKDQESCKDEERKDQESCKEDICRKGTPVKENKAIDTIIYEDSSEKEKVDPNGKMIEVEITNKEKRFDERKDKSNEGQLKMIKPEIHTSGDKQEMERREKDKIVEDVTGREIISKEIVDAVQLQQQNAENMFAVDDTPSIEDKDFLHKRWQTETANSEETPKMNREQKYNHKGIQALIADKTLDKDVIVDNIQKGNDANAYITVANRSEEFLVEVHSVRDTGDMEAEEIVKNELNSCEESVLHELYDVKVKGHFESEGEKNGSIGEFIPSAELSPPESACDENDVRFTSSEENHAEEGIQETESHNAKHGNGNLKGLVLSSNEKLDFEDHTFGSNMKSSSKDYNRDEKAPVGLEIATAKEGDMQRKEEKKSTMEDNNNNQLSGEEKGRKEVDDVQESLLQPENALLAMEVKEKEDLYEEPSNGIKNLNKASANANEVGGENHTDIIGLQDSKIIGSLPVKDYENKANLDKIGEMRKQGNELDGGETTKAGILIELSNLSNAPCLETEEQTGKSDPSEDTESVAWQTSSLQSEVAALKEVKMKEVYSPSEKEGGSCEIVLQEAHESTMGLAKESKEELDGNNLIKCEGDNENSYQTNYLIENEPCFVDIKKIDISREESPEKGSKNRIKAVTMKDNGSQHFSDNVLDDGEGQILIGNATSNIETEIKKKLASKEGNFEGQKEHEIVKGSKGNEYEVIERLIPGDGGESESIREAVIIRNREKERIERPLSIGEARVISPKHQKQVHFKKTEDNETSSEAIEKKAARGDDSEGRKAMNILSPSQHLAFDMTNAPFFDSSVDGESCSPSGASAESEFSLALKEKDKLQKALTTVKHQYEDLLKEFDKIIESNTKENNNNESVPISKENYNIALKCKEELEMEIRKAREQLAIVQAAHDSLSEELTWHSSEYECSEDSESISFDFDENRDESRWTSTPLPYDASLSNAAPKYVHCKNNSVQTDDESINEYKDIEDRKPVLQERGTNTSPESEAGTNAIGYGAHELSAVKSSELQRLPATLPRRRSKRRSKTLQLDELMQSDGKWVSRRSLVDKEQAKKNEKLTLQAIENAELKKELLLTKLEKIRLEAMLSCVMMRVSNADVEDGFKKMSLNSITSSTSTLRSATSLTNIAQNYPSSPLQAHSPFRKSHGRRVTSPLGEEHKSSQHRVRFDESRKTPSSTSPRSSSLFGHLSLLTQSSLSPSSLDIEISSYVSSDVSTPVPNERISPCGQDGDDSFQSPSSNQSKPVDTEIKEHDINVGYRGKSKLRLAACLPFRKKKKSTKESRTNREENFEDSYGANC